MYGDFNGGYNSGYAPWAPTYVAPVVPTQMPPFQQRQAQPMQVPQQAQYQQPTQKPPLQGVAWVNGLIGAQAYILQPNSSILLMDSDAKVFYIKTSDASGKAEIRSFKYEEQVAQPTQEPQVAYVTKEEFEKFKASFAEKKPAQPETEMLQ